jgi:hypothetical protein
MSRLQRYTNKEMGLAIRLPADWTVQSIDDDQFQVVSPPEPAFEEYRSSLSYTRTRPDTAEASWFEELIRESEEEQRATYPEYQLVDESYFDLKGNRAYRRQVRWRYPEADIPSVHVQWLIWPGGRVLFIVKAATLALFAESYLPVFDRIVSSTEFLGEGGER